MDGRLEDPSLCSICRSAYFRRGLGAATEVPANHTVPKWETHQLYQSGFVVEKDNGQLHGVGTA